jgi:L-iditol 2-dehydrogenase
MKIAAYVDTGIMEIREIPIPEPKDDEVLVKVEYCAICGSDIHQVQYGMEVPDNIMMGHEGSGIVAQVGKDVEGCKEGDRVIIERTRTCNACWYCLNGLSQFCKNKRRTSNGEFAEYLTCKPDHLYPLPDEVSLKAATLWNPLTNAINGVQIAGQKLDDFVVVLGAGPIGLLTIATARRSGAFPIIASEVLPKRAEAARKLGAHYVFNPREDNIMDAVRDIKEVGADIVYECAGAPETLQESVMYARCGGTVLLIAIYMDFFQFSTILWVMKQIKVQAAFGYTDQLPITVEMLRDGTINEDDIITSVISLDELPEMMKTLFGPNEEIKVVVKP